MGNSNTQHCKDLRQKSSKKHKYQILDDKGKNLNVLLDREHAAMLAKVIQWHGGAGRVTQRDVICFLIRQECQQIPADDGEF